MKKEKTPIRKTFSETENIELIRIRRNFQLTIPSELRRKVNLSVGDYVEADVEGDKIVIRPVEVASAGKKTQRELAQKRAFLVLDEVWSKLKDEDPRKTEALVEEAIREIRKKQ